MQFTKMHGLGNDFLVIDGRNLENTDYSALAIKYCNRHTGIGADGILIIENSDIADIRMRIVNNDGSIAEMCGNGMRCFAKYVYEHDIVRKTVMDVETLAGIVRPELILNGDRVEQIRVDMGCPVLDCDSIPVVGEGRCIDREMTMFGHNIRYTTVLVGVPHTIVFVDNYADMDVSLLGCAIEHASVFPKRTNVDFVHVINKNTIETRTWERGCGRTLCCGTGASSAAVACILNGKTENTVTVNVELGSLKIEWAENNHVYMTGPAAIVCEGETD